jgi:hypothetical protein
MRTLLPRVGYHEGLTRIQLWLVHHLVSQTVFDIWDVMLSEIEDTLAEGFRGHRQLPYAHWITFLIRQAVSQMTPETVPELTGATTEFPQYDMSQMFHHSRGRTPSQPSHRLEVPETAAEQDEAIRAIAETEEEELDAQQEDVVKSDPSDSSDDDYQPISQMPPHPHDR